jgi:hypothetical protein
MLRIMRMAALGVALTLAFSGLALARDDADNRITVGDRRMAGIMTATVIEIRDRDDHRSAILFGL